MSHLAALLSYSIRATQWTPVTAAAAAGLAFVLVMTLVPVTHDVAGTTNVLRVAALCGAVGAAFLLDDPSESTTAATAVSRPLRIMLRPFSAVPAILLWWAAVLLLLRGDTDAGTWRAVPLAGISLEMAALVTAAIAVAALAVRHPPHDGGGTAAAPTIAVLAAAAHFVPRRYRLFAAPGDQHWTVIHRWWAAIVVAAVLLLALASRDLAGTRRRAPGDRPRSPRS